MKTPAFYKERALKFANYILDNNTTTAKAAVHFCVSESTVQQSLKKWMPEVDKKMHKKLMEHLKNNKTIGFRGIGKRTLIECECTNCKHNNATSKNAKGYCTLGKITLVYKELDLKDGDETDVSDCEMFHFMYKGKEFMKG